MKKIKILALSLLTLLFTSCASSVYFKTEVLPDSKIEIGNNLKVFVPNTATIEEKKLKPIIEKLLIKNGYTVNDTKPFDFVLIYRLSDKSYTSTKIETDYTPTTSYTTGYVKGEYTTIKTTSQTADVSSRTITNTFKTNHFTIGNLDRVIVWEGVLSVDIDEYTENLENITNGMILLIGKDFNGNKQIDNN